MDWECGFGGAGGTISGRDWREVLWGGCNWGVNDGG